MNNSDLLLIVIFILVVVILILLDERRRKSIYLRIVLETLGYYSLRYGDVTPEDIYNRVGITNEARGLPPKEGKKDE